LETGTDDYLAKPVRMEDFEKVLERVVGKKGFSFHDHMGFS
jgi:YesN/AraC family two-component response regulator